MATSAAPSLPGVDRQGRRKRVETALRALGRPASERRSPPPDGRLGADEDRGRRLCETLTGLGPVFAGFGLYLASRIDLLPRRVRTQLAAIPDAGEPLPFASVAGLIDDQLGASPDRLFFEFQQAPFSAGLWTQRHLAWLSPGVPVIVTIVRPEAAAALDVDVQLLPALASWIDVPAGDVSAAVDDYAVTLRRRLDQRHQASSLATLSADARSGGGFDAPACYRDHCAPNVLTVGRVVGETLDERSSPGDALARRVSRAWLRQALSGNIVPYDFGPHDIMLAEDRLVLTGAAFEPHLSAERARFAAYLDSVAADNPDAAASWIVEDSGPSARVEEELRRVLRQAVPFRDGEWSGDDRLAEHVLVQWRVARNAGWPVSPHHQHLYRGLYALAQIAHRLAPDTDALLGALEDERMRLGLGQAARLLDPSHVAATLDRAIQELVDLPHKLDDVLTMASEGRLRTKLQVHDADESEHVRNRTVLLVTALVVFVGVAFTLRHLVPALGLGVERAGAVVLLLLGGWLLVAATRL